MRYRKIGFDNLFDDFRRDMQEFFSDEYDIFGPALMSPDERTLIGSDKKDLPAEQKRLRRAVTDIEEKDKKFVATVELPGADKDDIELNVHDNMLEIRSEKKHEEKKDEKGQRSYLKSYRGFYRCFSLPKNVDPEKIDANYKDGVLKIDIPKVELPEKKPKRIEVK